MERTDPETVLNLAAALDRMGGDRELLEEVALLFLESSPSQLERIEQAVRARDAEALERAAHTLKGSLGNFAAEAAFETALRLEKMGRSGDLTGAEGALQQLVIELERLRPALVTLGHGMR
jgi:HPt (histidine-containing phosphotransfer) domain-containing protein